MYLNFQFLIKHVVKSISFILLLYVFLHFRLYVFLCVCSFAYNVLYFIPVLLWIMELVRSIRETVIFFVNNQCHTLFEEEEETVKRKKRISCLFKKHTINTETSNTQNVSTRYKQFIQWVLWIQQFSWKEQNFSLKFTHQYGELLFWNEWFTVGNLKWSFFHDFIKKLIVEQ